MVNKLRILIWITLLLPASALAAESVLPAPSVSDVAISLGGIIVVILVLAWGLRRFHFTQRLGGAGGGIRIVTAMPVGARDRIVLLEVGDQQLLVGMSPGRMQTLHVLPKPLQSEAPAAPVGGFASKLKDAMGARKP